MENIIEYVRISRENPNRCTDFMNVGYAYMKETAADRSLEVHSKFLNSVLNRQNEKERWLIAVKVNAAMIGFAHFKIDRSERIGWGYILEFYIIPSFRKQGFGRRLYGYIKQEFNNFQINDIWLTADQVNGEPFWFSMGFRDTGKTENDLKVLEISI
jgi:GNAT superfamily N-acetyltransferase